MRDCGGWRDDGDQFDLYSQPTVLTLGRILNHLHRGRRHRTHDTLGGQAGLHLNDQPHHVHRILR